MAYVLTIPEIVESEPMLSLSAHPDGRTFGITIEAADTAVRLFDASATGRQLPLVVLTTDAGIIALDNVFVAQARTSEQSTAYFELVADAVRFV